MPLSFGYANDHRNVEKCMISNKVVEVGTNLNCVLHTTCRHNSNKGEETLDRDRMTDFNLRVLKHTFIKNKKK